MTLSLAICNSSYYFFMIQAFLYFDLDFLGLGCGRIADYYLSNFKFRDISTDDNYFMENILASEFKSESVSESEQFVNRFNLPLVRGYWECGSSFYRVV